ncbi:MAG: SH3 domain-containing protein [bacterium]
MNKKHKETIEDLMKEDESGEADLKGEIKEARGKSKTLWWVIGAIIVLLVLAGGGYAIWRTYQADKDLKQDEQKIQTSPEAKKTETTTQKTIYVNAEGGLNLRKEPAPTAEKIATIPNDTKLIVLEEKDGWYKVEYSGQTGWVSKEFTTEKNSLAYENSEYGFSLTFPSSWSGYKFYKKAMDDGSIVLYAELPTKDAAYAEGSSSDPGYASMFAISVLTQAQWDTVKNSEGIKPTYLGQNDKYVFAWSSAQATPTDLASQFKEIKPVLDTFQVKK